MSPAARRVETCVLQDVALMPGRSDARKGTHSLQVLLNAASQRGGHVTEQRLLLGSLNVRMQFGTGFKVVLVVIPCMLVQMLSLLWYSSTFIPGGQGARALRTLGGLAGKHACSAVLCLCPAPLPHFTTPRPFICKHCILELNANLAQGFSCVCLDVESMMA